MVDFGVPAGSQNGLQNAPLAFHFLGKFCTLSPRGPREAPNAPRDHFDSILGGSWAHLGSNLGQIWVNLGPSWNHFGVKISAPILAQILIRATEEHLIDR